MNPPKSMPVDEAFSLPRFSPILCALLVSLTGAVRAQEINVTNDATSTPILDGQMTAIDFGCTKPGVPVTRRFTIRNESLSENLILRADGLTLPPGYSLDPAWPTALITPTFRVVVQKDNAGAAADDSTSLDLIEVPSIISIDDITIKIPDALIAASNGPDSQTPFMDPGAGIAISQDPLKTTLDFDEVPGGGWICQTAGTFDNPNGDICAEFSGQSWRQGQGTRWQSATLRFRRPVLTGTLDDPSTNGSVFFGFGLVGLNPPRVIGTANDGDAFGQARIEVSVTLYNSASGLTEVVSGIFVDDMIENNRSEVILEGTPVLIPVPVVIPPGMTWEDVVGSPLTVQLDALSEGVFSGAWSLESNDTDENPFNFPITGIVDGTAPVLSNVPPNQMLPSVGQTCAAPASWTPPTVTDTDPNVSLVQTMGGAPGSSFPVGMNVIEYTATDCAGNSATAMFIINVLDQNPPTLEGSLPKRIIASALPGAMGAIVNYPALTAMDDCDPMPVVSCTPPSGSTFPLGLTTVTCVAVDSSGNMSAPKTMDVVVIEAQPSPSPRTLDAISLRNQPAPGVPGATFLGVNHALINNSGSVAIEATLIGAGTNNVGIWVNDGMFRLVSRKGDIAPGTANPIVSFNAVNLNAAGAVGMEARLSGATSTTDTMDLTDAGGALAKVIREGDTPPGTTALYSQLHEPAFNDQGTTYTPANLLLSAPTTVANDTGIWQKTFGGAVSQVAREGDPVGAAIAGASFGQVNPRVVANASGEIAFSAFLAVDNIVVNIANNVAIFSGSPSNLAVVVREGETAPGPDAPVYQTFAAESINNNGKVAFEAGLITGGGPPVTSANNAGLFTNSGGAIELVAREGDPAPCLGAPAGVFSDFREIFIADNGDVFFRAYLKGTNVDSTNDGTFWKWRASDATLHPIVREGDAAAGTLGAVYGGIIDVTANAKGAVALTATLNPGIGDATLSNNYGLWLDDGTDGIPLLRVREGDTLSFGGQNPAITVLAIESTANVVGGSGGHGMVLNDSSEVVLRISTNLNSSGTFVLPSP
jgi:hypothetical protein